MAILHIDPNIPETGEQLVRSNNGPNTCCYEYCDAASIYSGICAACNLEDADPGDVPSNIDNKREPNESSISAQYVLSPQTCNLVSLASIYFPIHLRQ